MKRVQFKLLWVLAAFLLPGIQPSMAQEFMQINLSNGSVMEIPIADIQKLTFDLSTGIQPNSQVLTQLLKFKAYPNPAKDYLNLDYTLVNEGEVLLEVLNIGGERVFSKTLGQQQPGDYQHRWQTQNVPSGTYICRIQQNKEIVSEKIIIKK